MVKIFPENTFGPNYLKSLKGALPQNLFMVTRTLTLIMLQNMQLKVVRLYRYRE